MSPSWTRAWRPAVACRAGIAIGRQQLTAVLLDDSQQPPRLRALHTQALAAPLFDGPPSAAAEDALVQALQAVSSDLAGRYAAVHVALPDFALRSAVFELEQLPRPARLQQALLRWRFAQAWQRSEDSLECRGQDLGRDGARHLLFAQAGDRAWLDCVRRALARVDIGPWSLNAAAVYRFNAFHDTLSATPGALLALDADGWSLLIWDEQGRLRQSLIRLRANASEPLAVTLAAIADEAERAILAYVQAEAGRRVERLYLTGEREDGAALCQTLNSRLREPARLLPADAAGGAAFSSPPGGLASLALLAAATGTTST